MGRNLHSVIRIEGDLVAKTPVHSGGLRDSVFTDLPLAVNGKGEVYFPGSAIAGPLRAWWRFVCPELEDKVWGRVEGQGGEEKGSESSEKSGWASILFVHDAPLVQAIGLDLAQHVAIDRSSGTAAFNKKFDRELAPVEARFRLCLELQRPAKKYGPEREMDDSTWEQIQGALRGMLEGLCEGNIRFGADKSRGRGKLVLENEKIFSRDLGSGILNTLRKAADSKGISEFFGKIEAIRPSPQRLKLFLKCQPVAPVMQRHEAEGTAVDMLPAVAVEGDERKPFLSGTGIKGAFRAQSARILRTVLGCEDADEDSLYLVGALYGTAKKADRKDEKPKKAPQVSSPDAPDYRQPGQGAVSFDDCRMDRPLSLDDWRRLLTLDTSGSTERLAHFRKEAENTKWADFRPVAHVAIDRWTGGAANKFLFSRLEPALDEIELTATIDFERIAPPLAWWVVPCGCASKGKEELVLFRRAAFALFILTLRDFARGRIPLGYGVNRGLGDLDLTKVAFAGLETKTWEGMKMPSSLAAGDFGEQEKMEVFQPLQEAWCSYIKANKSETGS